LANRPSCWLYHNICGILVETFILVIDLVLFIQELDNIGEVLNRNIELPVQYKESMRKAMHVFKHQIVYDCGLDQLCPCTPYPPDATDYGDYAGEYPLHLCAKNR